jgi:dTDP-4-amino-4,6-dideoxygalactose transaminase
VLVDVDPQTYTLDPNRLEETLRRLDRRAGRPRAVIPVHLYGHPADMPAVLDVARRHELIVIEDCAQSHGAALNGHRTGTFGQGAAFSFYPTKNLGALGDGGAVVTGDAELAARARLLREYGWRERYVSELPGMNTRLDEIQAAILRAKLPHLDAENARRRALAARYDRALDGTGLGPPAVRGDVTHVYHQYVVRSRRRDELKAYLQARGVGTAIHYPVPVHMQPAYQGRVALGVGGLAETERAAREVLSLPMYPQLTDEQAAYVCEQFAGWRE